MVTQSKRQRDRERRRNEAERAQRAHAQFVAQQQREAARQERAALQAQRQAEREQQARYVAEQQAEAKSLTERSERRCEELQEVLRTGLKRSVIIDFNAVRVKPVVVEFMPNAQLASPEPEPRWDDFTPTAPSAVARLFGGAARYEKRLPHARLRFEQEQAAHRLREEHRRAQLDQARQDHLRQQAERQQRDAQHNAEIDALEQDFQAGEPAAVEGCLRSTLEAEELPCGVPNDVEVGYRSEPGHVLILRRLPDTDVIPKEASFRYIKNRDALESTLRRPAELHRRYADLIAQLALLTLRDVFYSTTEHLVREVTVNCHLPTTDPATGRSISPCLLTVSATRAEFSSLVLDKLQAPECLRALNALMSAHPYDVEPVKPLFDPDLSRFRLVDAQEVAASIDSRAVLIKMSPTEFEHFVRELFEAMGMESWNTQASRDDGVDAIALNPDPIMGGLCVIQAKRYTNVVPPDAVRALWGVMEDKKASTGVLVTTSYFGKATHDFAHRNERVRLIEGPELKHLVKAHLDLDIIPGGRQPSRSSQRPSVG